jgi:8-amino-7-oxononanoate synthase
MSMDETLDDELDALARAGLLRVPRTIAGAQGRTVQIDGRELLCLCSNNYLGLAGDPRLVGPRSEGAGAGASRLISGTMAAHRAAERALARFVGTPSALLFSSGYAANVGALSALLDDPRDVVFSDALNHASIIDGCRLARAEVAVYPHRDLAALEQLLATHRPLARRALIVTDAVFSMDGDRAPLRALRALADAHDAWLMVDEAHALGVLGPEGRGLSAELDVRPDVLVGTLGKALGLSGAFVAGPDNLARFLENRARSYVFSTATSPEIARALCEAIEIVTRDEGARARVLGHADRLRRELAGLGYDARGERTPIVPVVIGHNAETLALADALFARGVFAHGVRPPTVPEGTSRIRLVPMASHTEADIDHVIAAFAEIRPERAPADARP